LATNQTNRDMNHKPKKSELFVVLCICICLKEGVKVRRPPKFSWVVDGLLAAQGRPTLPDHLQYLCDNNVKYIITLTKTRPRALLELPGV